MRVSSLPDDRTIFYKSRTPLVKWFWAIYLMARDKGGVSAMRLAKEPKLGHKTAWLMLTKIRRAMAHRDERYLLHSLVEVDESFSGDPRPGQRGRGEANKTAVLVMAEDQGERPGFIALALMPDLTQAKEVRAVKTRMAADKALKTNEDLNDGTLEAEGYAHDGAVALPQQAGQHLPRIHRVISLAKRTLLGTFHRVGHKPLGRYLSEFSCRFNRRWKEKALLCRVLTACISAETITYPELEG